MNNGKLSSLLNFKKLEWDNSKGPDLISWQCSASVVIFPQAQSLLEAAKFSNFDVQASWIYD